MLINEGLPLYLVSRLERRYDLFDKTVGLLGMAFKGESDDIRSSLSYKLRRILLFRAKEVLCTDPYVTDDERLCSLEEVLERSQLVVVDRPGTPVELPSLPAVGEWIRVEVPRLEVSSTDLRARVQDGRPLQFLVTEPVLELIVARHLYSEAA